MKAASKISFKRHKVARQDYSELPLHDWDHQNIPFDKARKLLDGLLDWRALQPWSFRKGLGYQIRSQDDFQDVFQLRRFVAAHSDWKPFLCHLLGFNAGVVESHYQKVNELNAKESSAESIKAELHGSMDLSQIEGILLIKQKEAEKKQRLLDDFDFRPKDKEATRQLIDDIDQQIASLNTARYSHKQNLKKIDTSLEEEQIIFNPDQAEKLFKEAGVIFAGQIKKDFEQMISYNKAITEERRTYLKEERSEIVAELKHIDSELDALGKERSLTLSYLSDTDIFSKYKKVADELVTLRADITSLERQRDYSLRLQQLRSEIRQLSEECGHLQSQMEEDFKMQNTNPDSLFTAIRTYFNDIVDEVIDCKALLSVSLNNRGNPIFGAEILDDAGNSTSAGLGHTYRKLLCIAFDLAILRARIDDQFPHFVYHDGVFESLDDRKKENLLKVIRRYTESGVQSIITLIDSDLPAHSDSSQLFFDNEIVLTLHDEGVEGRLFKMDTW